MKPLAFLCVSLAAISFAQEKPVERTASLTGTIKYHHDFESKVRKNKRNITVWLPPGYDVEPNRRYPVLYMHDGQNIFDGMTSYIPNKEWRVDECATGLINAKLIEPIIIVGIDNAGMERGDEYLPIQITFGTTKTGGKADEYGDMMMTEIMPMINKTYRTKTGAANTALCGSSFGGVITCYLGLKHTDAFSKLGIVSPSVWVGNRYLVDMVKKLPSKTNQRVWIDMGTSEGMGAVKDCDALAAAMRGKGWRDGKDLAYYVDGYALHNEEAWARRMNAILLFLYRK
jgi:predicted alpha/beta superfamily hydrolase